MADIEIKNSAKKKSGRQMLKKRLAVDLTPMVDLGFLLITFFILTTSLTKPTITKLYVPKDDISKTPVCESCVLTLLPAGNNEVYYYEGMPDAHTAIGRVNFSIHEGLRELLQQKRQKIFSLKGTATDMVVIIKPGKRSSYKNLMDILDEININDIKYYFLSERESIDQNLISND